MKVRRAFYKANWKHLSDFLIVGWTFPFSMFMKPILPFKFYSHEEIGFVIDGEWKYFSSTLRKHKDKDGKMVNGTRWIKAKELFKHPERWDVYEKDYMEEKVRAMIRIAKAEENKRYDKLGICGFLTLTGLILNRKLKWYCSEVCRYLANLGVWIKRVSPIRDGKLILKEGYLLCAKSSYLVV